MATFHTAGCVDVLETSRTLQSLEINRFLIPWPRRGNYNDWGSPEDQADRTWKRSWKCDVAPGQDPG